MGGRSLPQQKQLLRMDQLLQFDNEYWLQQKQEIEKKKNHLKYFKQKTNKINSIMRLGLKDVYQSDKRTLHSQSNIMKMKNNIKKMNELSFKR